MTMSPVDVTVFDATSLDHYWHLAKLVSAATGMSVSAGELQAGDAQLPRRDDVALDEDGRLVGFARRRVLAAHDGETIGTAVAWRAPWTPPGSLASDLVIVPERPERDAAMRAMLDDLAGWGRRLGASALLGVVDDRLTDRVRLLQDLGYAIDAHVVEGRVSDVQSRALAWREAFAASAGELNLAFITLDRTDRSHADRQLYSLFQRTLPDNPGHVDEIPDFDTWYADSIGAPDARADWVFLAYDKEDLAGVCLMLPADEPGTAYVEYTGVDRRWRGRGLAKALKTWAAATVASEGIGTLVTEWEVSNTPIARANASFGFTISGGHYRVIRRLG